MREHNCCLKWPMAITQAMRLSKPEDILALLATDEWTTNEMKE